MLAVLWAMEIVWLLQGVTGSHRAALIRVGAGVLSAMGELFTLALSVLIPLCDALWVGFLAFRWWHAGGSGIWCCQHREPVTCGAGGLAVGHEVFRPIENPPVPHPAIA